MGSNPISRSASLAGYCRYTSLATAGVRGMLVVDGHQLVAVAEHVADCLAINADDSTGNPLQQCTRSPTVRHDSSVTTGSYRSGPARGAGSCTGVPGW